MADGEMSAVTTNLHSYPTTKAITTKDHIKISPGDILVMLEYTDLGNGGIWIWLFRDRVVWQTMRNTSFENNWIKL